MAATKLLSTCEQCRARKVRCLKALETDASCIICDKREEQCVFAPVRKRRMQTSRSRGLTPHISAPPSSRSDILQPSQSMEHMNGMLSPPLGAYLRTPTQAQLPALEGSLMPAPLRESSGTSLLYMDKLLIEDNNGVREKDNTVFTSDSEHVLSSTLAFFSARTINTLSYRLGHDRLRQLVVEIEEGHQNSIRTGLELLESLHVSRPLSIKSPDTLTCAQYIKAYFEHVHPIYPFLDQEAFEAKASCADLDNVLSSSKPWTALYYSVLSLGCMYHDGGSFSPGKGLAWSYFRIVLDCLAGVLLSPSSLLKAQVMTAMAVFALNCSALPIETLCITEAARTVMSLGLNKRCIETSSDDTSRRIFWVVYCIEKEYTFNSTIASSIPDYDVKCPLSTNTATLLGDFNWILCWSRYSRILSKCYESLFSTSARLNSEAEHFQAVDDIRSLLDAWKDSVPEKYRPGIQMRQYRFEKPFMKEIALRIHFAYYNLQICLARLIIHLCNDNKSTQWFLSKNHLLESAISVVDLTHLISIEPFEPIWIIGHVPVVALFILFDFIIQNPLHAQTTRNVSYLDIIAAYHARVDIMSGGSMPSSGLRELASIARDHVDTMSRQNSIKDPASSDLGRRYKSASHALYQTSQVPLDPAVVDSMGSSAAAFNDMNNSFFDPFSTSGCDSLDLPDENSSLLMSFPQGGFDFTSGFTQNFL